MGGTAGQLTYGNATRMARSSGIRRDMKTHNNSFLILHLTEATHTSHLTGIGCEKGVGVIY